MGASSQDEQQHLGSLTDAAAVRRYVTAWNNLGDAFEKATKIKGRLQLLFRGSVIRSGQQDRERTGAGAADKAR